MHVVREQRLSAGRVRAGDDPVVGAGRAAVAGGQAEQGAQGAEIVFGRRRVAWVRSSSSSSSSGWGRLGMRLAQVEQCAGGRTVAPGADGVKIGLELGVVELWRRCARARA